MSGAKNRKGGKMHRIGDMIEDKVLVCMTGDEYAALQSAGTALAGLVDPGAQPIAGSQNFVKIGRSAAVRQPAPERMCDVCGLSLGSGAAPARKRHVGQCTKHYHRQKSAEWSARNPEYRPGKGGDDRRKAKAVEVAVPGTQEAATELEPTEANNRIRAALKNVDRKLGKAGDAL